MTPADPPIAQSTVPASSLLPRVLPLALVLLATVAVFALGLHRQISLEALVSHRAAIDAFVAANALAAIAAYIALYIATVALSIPGSAILTISGGLLFGTLIGGLAATVASTIGAIVIFLIARGAIGEWLVCRAGPRVAKIAGGFRADAFSYLLFLRLIPLFPFWLVNLVAAIGGVALGPFVAATAVGVMPAAFVFALFGAGLDSALAGQVTSYQDCLLAGGMRCKLDFDMSAALTPKLLAGFGCLAVLALMPVLAKQFRAARHRSPDTPHA
jgi:uncharacterized membrane protein YdjX (TVP38/TMEM64 family)